MFHAHRSSNVAIRDMCPLARLFQINPIALVHAQGCQFIGEPGHLYHLYPGSNRCKQLIRLFTDEQHHRVVRWLFNQF